VEAAKEIAIDKALVAEMRKKKKKKLIIIKKSENQ
jgi:hypothetical protein